VGYELARLLPAIGYVIALDFPEVDLAKPEDLRRLIREVGPRIIVNAAAYTAVDQAEAEPERAMAVNGAAPEVMAAEAKRLGAMLVHYSTDYVYDGSKNGPYVETDPPNPRNSYGRSKLAGDLAVLESNAPHFVFRTSWVYGSRGKNFLLTMLRLFGERSEVQVVDDQIGAPTWCRQIARATVTALQPAAGGNDGFEQVTQRSGLYHLTAGGSTSWFGFASAIHASRFPAGGGPRLLPILTTDYPLPARRPMNSLLDNSQLARVLGIAQVGWREQLAECLREG